MTWKKVSIAEIKKGVQGVCDNCGEASSDLLADSNSKICKDCAEDIAGNMHADALRELQPPRPADPNAVPADW